MLVVETIAKIRRAYFFPCSRPIKEICRELALIALSKVVRKAIIRSKTPPRFALRTLFAPTASPGLGLGDSGLESLFGGEREQGSP